MSLESAGLSFDLKGYILVRILQINSPRTDSLVIQDGMVYLAIDGNPFLTPLHMSALEFRRAIENNDIVEYDSQYEWSVESTMVDEVFRRVYKLKPSDTKLILIFVKDFRGTKDHGSLKVFTYEGLIEILPPLT